MKYAEQLSLFLHSSILSRHQMALPDHLIKKQRLSFHKTEIYHKKDYISLTEENC